MRPIAYITHAIIIFEFIFIEIYDELLTKN